MPNKLVTAVSIIIAAIGVSEVWAAGIEGHGYPRIMSVNIGRPTYYDTPEYQAALSKPHIVILGFWEGWGKSKKNMSERDVVRRLKELNPKLLVGQYTILNEWKDIDDPSNTRPEVSRKLDRENWWLHDGDGKRVRWTDKYRAWDTNITIWSKPDRNGDRYPQWLAEKNYKDFFLPVPDFDIWYFDNSLSRPPVKEADWDGDGRDDSRNDSRIAAAYRQGNVAHWEAARRLHPQAIFMGNSDDVSSLEYSGKLQSVFMEAVIGASWSVERLKGWEAVMERYRSAMEHTAKPHIVGFNVHGKIDDYQRMRYGLTSCLLDDGYFSYTDEHVGYGSVPWFDEYDVDLGMPIELPVNRPRPDGVYSRKFERGLVLVNPGLFPKSVVIEGGYRRIKGEQALRINDGSRVTSITLSGKDGIVLLRDSF